MENSQQNNEAKIENAVKKYTISEFRILVFLIGAIAAVLAPYFLTINRLNILEKDVNTIQTNELVHIAADIKDLKDEMKVNSTEHSEIDKKLERILTILEK